MSKYYSLKNIKKKKATYNIIFGERSNGKTYALLKESLEVYFKTGGQLGLIRRWKEDIIGKRASGIFNAINGDGVVQELSGGEYSGVCYYAGRFFVCNYDDKGKPIYNESDCFGYVFAISDGEHNKSISFPMIQTIVFDEFLTKNLYLQDEFVHFMNTISTIVRQRTDVTIYMLGNTVNKYCPYFEEMGLKNILKMEQGSIDVYRYGESELKVAVEYCSSTEKNKKNNFYFAFDNPKLSMITGGSWEMDMYPHLPIKYKPNDIKLIYFIEFNDRLLQCEIIKISSNETFTYIHNKTTDLQNTDKDIIYTLEYNPKMNYNRNILKANNVVGSKIAWYYKNDKVFYQNNDVGDLVNNYLKYCGGF